MTLAAYILLLVTIALFVGGGVATCARLRTDRRGYVLAAESARYAGCATLAALVILRAMASSRGLPMDDTFAAFSLLALLIALAAAYVQRRRPMLALDCFAMPAALALLVAAAFIGITAHPYQDTVWSWAHRVSAYLGAAAFFLAGSAGAAYLLLHRRLRSGVVGGPPMGSLQRLDSTAYLAVTIGFPLLTVGLITGVLRAAADSQTRLGPNWFATPKFLLAAAVWLVYAIVLHAPIQPALRGKKTAALSLVGLILLIGTLVAVQLMPAGGTTP